MAYAHEQRSAVFINTPISYPSGTSVVIRIDGARDKFFVTDAGFGHQESMMICASNSYSRIARALVRDTGVSFDDRSFFVAEGRRDDLVPIVAAVANFSQRAVVETLLKHEASRVDRGGGVLFTRLEGALGAASVERDYEIRGASSVEWDVAAGVVSSGKIVSIFDHAKPHKNSVVSTVAKFHDIARLPSPPRRIITVSDKTKMGGFLGLLSQAANVVSISDMPDDALRMLAA